MECSLFFQIVKYRRGKNIFKPCFKQVFLSSKKDIIKSFYSKKGQKPCTFLLVCKKDTFSSKVKEREAKQVEYKGKSKYKKTSQE